MTNAASMNSASRDLANTPAETPLRELIRHCGPAALIDIPGFGTAGYSNHDVATYGYMHPAHHLAFPLGDEELSPGSLFSIERGATVIPLEDEEGVLPGGWGLLVIGNHKGVLICSVAVFPDAPLELSSAILTRLGSRMTW
ncbi:hypothetical protein [Mycobacteroides abscessus]|uniref:hypothetical protein n=2 Tax=Mycobacteroides abscessus TaxID=36809 RepID=UPI001041E0D1|nr:hypothetical protein [Mycobacteroides abscessus]MDO3312589.1 hypothetical protein [Mycobacteroides abscessus subsp. abscessus]MDO3344729.1 hypothetical protein [Mycobacteroides abscessus subsp. abscessus]